MPLSVEIPTNDVLLIVISNIYLDPSIDSNSLCIKNYLDGFLIILCTMFIMDCELFNLITFFFYACCK